MKLINVAWAQAVKCGVRDDLGGFEALFILDHRNGNLQAWLINGRTSDLGGGYRTNVLAALGGKEGRTPIW